MESIQMVSPPSGSVMAVVLTESKVPAWAEQGLRIRSKGNFGGLFLRFKGRLSHLLVHLYREGPAPGVQRELAREDFVHKKVGCTMVIHLASTLA